MSHFLCLATSVQIALFTSVKNGWKFNIQYLKSFMQFFVKINIQYLKSFMQFFVKINIQYLKSFMQFFVKINIQI